MSTKRCFGLCEASSVNPHLAPADFTAKSRTIAVAPILEEPHRMSRRHRRVGRSDEERREALNALQRQWEAGAGRAHLTTEQLRRARAAMEQRLARAEDRRRAEDRIRDEYHDSRAIIVTWTRHPRPATKRK
jgi:hypothetical protein